jgi:hypothetical protein
MTLTFQKNAKNDFIQKFQKIIDEIPFDTFQNPNSMLPKPLLRRPSGVYGHVILLEFPVATTNSPTILRLLLKGFLVRCCILPIVQESLPIIPEGGPDY